MQEKHIFTHRGAVSVINHVVSARSLLVHNSAPGCRPQEKSPGHKQPQHVGCSPGCNDGNEDHLGIIGGDRLKCIFLFHPLEFYIVV